MKDGYVIHSPIFLFRFLKDPLNKGAFAFVAPKSVAKTAVLRNKLRRRGYALLRREGLKPISGIFFYKKGTATSSIIEVKASIKEILNKVR